MNECLYGSWIYPMVDTSMKTKSLVILIIEQNHREMVTCSVCITVFNYYCLHNGGQSGDREHETVGQTVYRQRPVRRAEGCRDQAGPDSERRHGHQRKGLSFLVFPYLF